MYESGCVEGVLLLSGGDFLHFCTARSMEIHSFSWLMRFEWICSQVNKASKKFITNALDFPLYAKENANHASWCWSDGQYCQYHSLTQEHAFPFCLLIQVLHVHWSHLSYFLIRDTVILRLLTAMASVGCWLVTRKKKSSTHI